MTAKKKHDRPRKQTFDQVCRHTADVINKARLMVVPQCPPPELLEAASRVVQALAGRVDDKSAGLHAAERTTYWAAMNVLSDAFLKHLGHR